LDDFEILKVKIKLSILFELKLRFFYTFNMNICLRQTSHRRSLNHVINNPSFVKVSLINDHQKQNKIERESERERETKTRTKCFEHKDLSYSLVKSLIRNVIFHQNIKGRQDRTFKAVKSIEHKGLGLFPN